MPGIVRDALASRVCLKLGAKGRSALFIARAQNKTDNPPNIARLEMNCPSTIKAARLFAGLPYNHLDTNLAILKYQEQSPIIVAR
jgi:hypothetical protein